MDTALGLLPAYQLVDLVHRRKISARELLQHFLDRVAALNPAINAVITMDVESAQQRAYELDRWSARGQAVGPLHGLPMTVKDALATAGMRSTSGAAELAESIPSEDAVAVARLRAAGANIFGKTNLPSWSGDVQSYNPIFGTTNNPWDLTKTPGGSSGGSAAAVASGMTGLELGTDIGGSVRIPASFCGVYGHKPSYGIVPQDGCIDRLDGDTAHADINVIGPIGRHPRDLALALGVIAGPAGRADDAWSLSLPKARHGRFEGYRIGVWVEDGSVDLDREVVMTIRSALDRISDAGAAVVPAHPNVDLAEAIELYRHLVYAAASVHHPWTAGRDMAGGHRDWLEYDHRRRQLIAEWERWFEDFDVLVCPVIPSPAFEHDHSGPAKDRPFIINGAAAPHHMATAWTGSIGILHLPATAVPVGLTARGLPVGVQVVGPRYRDLDCLRVAELLGEILGEYRPPPMALPGAIH